MDNKFIICVMKAEDLSSGTFTYSAAELHEVAHEIPVPLTGLPLCLFLILLGTELLVVFDQHAAHERVRLEQLTKGTWSFFIHKLTTGTQYISQ